MSDERPIGVFDSGVGGLTVVAALSELLPAESILYLGDTARLPYGTKSPETVLRYSQRTVDFLVDRDVKGVVVACNTASAVALDRLDVSVPLWGVVRPGARRAADITRGRVGVVATESTVRSDAYGRELRALAPGLEVLSRACPLLVPLVEEGWHRDPITRQVVERYLEPLVTARIDTLVLGCTHYPLLTDALMDVLTEVPGEGVEIVDSGRATAEAVAAELDRLGLRTAGTEDGEEHYCVTDLGERFERIAALFLAVEAVSLEHVEL